MMLSIGTVAYAHENVDNTFDNYTPQPGQEAPDNWYDPYSYDSEGLILPNSLDGGCGITSAALYCKTHKKIFQNNCVFIGDSKVGFYPYQTLLPAVTGEGENVFIDVDYCPYCGLTEAISDENHINKVNSNLEFQNNHMHLSSIGYGAFCPDCGEFDCLYLNSVIRELPNERYCSNCSEFYICDKNYRFVAKDDLNSEAAHIYSDSAHLYGDGVDGVIEDLVLNEIGIAVGWNPGSSDEPAELTFWDKIVQFFVSIGDFFVKLFTWSW